MTNVSTSRTVLRLFILTLVFATSFLLASSALAATVTWNGDGDGSTWSDSDNWDTDSVPGNGDTAVIETATTVNITAGDTIGELVLGDSGGGVASILNFAYDAVNVGASSDPLVVTTASGGTGNITVYGSAKITHSQNTTSNNYNIYLDVSGQVDIQSSGSIDVDGLGCEGATYAIGRGPNTSTGVCTAGNAGSGGNPGDGGGYGGEGGRSHSNTSRGDTYGSSTQPNLVGSSGGGDNAQAGGAGGGLVYIEVDAGFTLDGSITADGAAGGGSGASTGSGGSGGGVYLNITGAWDGSGSITADGGDGADGTTDAGGGGGGGRIAVLHDNGTFVPTSVNLTVAAGSAGTASSEGSPLTEAGDKGTVYTNDSDTGTVTIFHGFTYAETDHSVTRWTMDSSATNQYCESGIASPSISAGTLDLAGTIDCDSSSLTSFNLSATSEFNMGSGFTFNLSDATHDADSDWTIPDGDDQIWTNVTISMPGSSNPNTDDEGGVFTIDDVITIDVAGTSAINGNMELTNLDGFTLGASASLNASQYGCTANWSGLGSGPDSSNICTSNGQGSGGNGTGGGGSGHGGAGGTSSGGASGGSTYGSATAPVLIGAAGGADGSGRGGNGGGLVRIEVDAGNMTWNGAITADGGTGVTAGSVGGGGGAGGSVYITVSGALSGSTGSVSADGGLGADTSGSDGGSGGGGRVRVEYGADSTSFLSGLTASGVATGGAAAGGGSAGSDGSLSTADIYGPSLSSAQYEDNDGDGQIDRILLDFNEDITLGGTVADTRFTFTSPTGASGFGGSLSGNASISSGDVIITVSSADADETGASGTVQIAYDDNSDDATDKLTDSTGNIVETFSATTVGDGAGPLLVSSSPADADSNISSSADVILTFTETITTGSFTYTCCGAGDDPGRSGVWSSSDTVYTISPSSNWTAGDDVTINITAAPDGSSNAFVGAVSGSADPFTFTIANVGDTPTNIGGVVTTATLTAPNGGQAFEGGDTTTITWSAGANKLDSISLYYTTDNGKTYTLIADNEENDGAYIWTVPNITSSTVRVKVAAMTSSGGELVSDSSNSNLSITEVEDADIPQVNTDDEETDEEPSDDPITSMLDRAGNTIDLHEGYLFRGDTLSDVYLVKNGKRYVFPSADVFLSYYEDFDDVYFMQDDQLRKLDLGGRVTMAPGEMIKIQSDNRVFQVQSDGTIRHIPDEATAIALYGDTWNQQITDISVIFWGDYPQREQLESL